MYTYHGKRFFTLHYAVQSLWHDLREDRLEAVLMGRTWRPPVLCIYGPGREAWVWRRGSLQRVETLSALVRMQEDGTWTPQTAAL